MFIVASQAAASWAEEVSKSPSIVAYITMKRVSSTSMNPLHLLVVDSACNAMSGVMSADVAEYVWASALAS